MSFPRIAQGPPPLEGLTDEQISLLAAHPVTMPSLNIRDPIQGKKPRYSVGLPEVSRAQRAAVLRSAEHTNSIFTDTRLFRSYYIISPEWTSEALGHRRLAASRRPKYGYDRRPDVQPLASFYLPELVRREKTELQRPPPQPELERSATCILPSPVRDSRSFRNNFLSEEMSITSSIPF